jgi:long-chain acyl-CoA synthetase
VAAANAAAQLLVVRVGSGQHVATLPCRNGGIAEVVLRAAPDAPGAPAGEHGHMAVPTPRPVAPPDASSRAPTLGRMILSAADRHSGAALRSKREGAWTDISFTELGVIAHEIARGLLALGIRPGDRVAVLSSTRPEWTLADCGALCAGATVVPVYQTNSPEECQYVLAHSEARVVFCEDDAQVAKIAQVRADCPALEHVISFAPGDAELTLDQLRELGVPDGDVDLNAIQRAVAPDDVATIIYTSGTTGPPKGCVVTHAACLATIQMYERRIDLGPAPVIFMFLPLAHSLTRITELFALDAGATMAFWTGDPARLLDDLREAAPTHLPSVPRVFEKIHTAASSRLDEAGVARRALMRWALSTGAQVRDLREADGSPGLLLRARHVVADRLVLSKIRALFGANLRMAMTGAAPISEDVLDFFSACGVAILEGYGMTETCAAGTFNTLDEHRFGSVGRALPGVELALGEDGKILMRGPQLFSGYYRDQAATDESFADGWLRSGDLGEIDPQGFLRITGRKKEVIITSSGKNIAPTNIEAALRESRWISQAVVYGDNRPYLVALVTLDPEEAPALAARVGCDPDVTRMTTHPGVRAELQAAVDAANARFARIEQVKRFAVLERDLTLGDGELTPTLKVKRRIAYERYRDNLEALYEP